MERRGGRRDGPSVFHKNRFKLLGKIGCAESESIIVEKEKTLYFVEVKFRKNALYGRGEESIHFAKQRKIVLAALDYLQRKKISEKEVRFGGLIIDGSVSPFEVQWLEFPLDLPPQYY